MFLKKIVYIVILVPFLFSCKTEEVYLYDKTGFKPARPAFYLSTDPGYSGYKRPIYQGYNSPYSGAYQNPYDFPPQNYRPYYDYDYYYIPPSQYKNVEPEFERGVGGKL